MMTNRLVGLLVAGVLGVGLAIASPAQAFHGGMHMGGGGMHWGGGGMHWGGGGMHWGGVGPRHFAVAPFGHRAFFAPHFRRFAFHDRDDFFRHRRFDRDDFRFRHRFFFRHHHRFAFIGAPFAFAAYDGCWRRVWTAYGRQWVNVCDPDYGY